MSKFQCSVKIFLALVTLLSAEAFATVKEPGVKPRQRFLSDSNHPGTILKLADDERNVFEVTFDRAKGRYRLPRRRMALRAPHSLGMKEGGLGLLHGYVAQIVEIFEGDKVTIRYPLFQSFFDRDAANKLEVFTSLDAFIPEVKSFDGIQAGDIFHQARSGGRLWEPRTIHYVFADGTFKYEIGGKLFSKSIREMQLLNLVQPRHEFMSERFSQSVYHGDEQTVPHAADIFGR